MKYGYHHTPEEWAHILGKRRAQLDACRKTSSLRRGYDRRYDYPEDWTPEAIRADVLGELNLKAA